MRTRRPILLLPHPKVWARPLQPQQRLQGSRITFQSPPEAPAGRNLLSERKRRKLLSASGWRHTAAKGDTCGSVAREMHAPTVLCMMWHPRRLTKRAPLAAHGAVSPGKPSQRPFAGKTSAPESQYHSLSYVEVVASSGRVDAGPRGASVPSSVHRHPPDRHSRGPEAVQTLAIPGHPICQIAGSSSWFHCRWRHSSRIMIL